MKGVSRIIQNVVHLGVCNEVNSQLGYYEIYKLIYRSTIVDAAGAVMFEGRNILQDIRNREIESIRHD